MPNPDPKPYTYVRLRENKERSRFEVRVSTFIEFDEHPGRRAISGKPSKDEALEIAKKIARQRTIEHPD